MSDTQKIRIAVLGASGYTGAELLRFLVTHPAVQVVALSAETQAGKQLAEVYPHLAGFGLPDLVAVDAIDYTQVDVVFCCLPHGTTQAIIKALPTHLRVIDLSADFRLADEALYATWYGHAHQAPELQKQAVYGLTEIQRDAVRNARLVACPGCYPTSVQLPLIPLLQAGLIQAEDIIIDAKSGVTGAGRGAKQATLFTELNDGLSAYGIGHHRHTPEIEQGLGIAAGVPVQVSFTPHLIPMNRGILSTIYVRLSTGATVDALQAELEKRYLHEPFVMVMPKGVAPSTHQVRGTNQCRIAVFADSRAGRAIIVSVIDNLVKGASGQAVQNFNCMYELDEQTSLRVAAVFP